MTPLHCHSTCYNIFLLYILQVLFYSLHFLFQKQNEKRKRNFCCIIYVFALPCVILCTYFEWITSLLIAPSYNSAGVSRRRCRQRTETRTSPQSAAMPSFLLLIFLYCSFLSFLLDTFFFTTLTTQSEFILYITLLCLVSILAVRRVFKGGKCDTY